MIHMINIITMRIIMITMTIITKMMMMVKVGLIAGPGKNMRGTNHKKQPHWSSSLSLNSSSSSTSSSDQHYQNHHYLGSKLIKICTSWTLSDFDSFRIGSFHIYQNTSDRSPGAQWKKRGGRLPWFHAHWLCWMLPWFLPKYVCVYFLYTTLYLGCYDSFNVSLQGNLPLVIECASMHYSKYHDKWSGQSR